MAMQGILASHGAVSHGEPQLAEVAQLARAYADALIAELMESKWLEASKCPGFGRKRARKYCSVVNHAAQAAYLTRPPIATG
jgi:hypothetical protein